MFKNTRRRYDRIIQRAMDGKISRKDAVDYFLECLKEKNAAITALEITGRVAEKKMKLLESALWEQYEKEVQLEFEDEENKEETEENDGNS